MAAGEAHPEAARKAEVKSRLYQMWQSLGMAGVLLVLCVIMAIFAPHFLTFHNVINVARQVSINAILAAGMTFVILTGGIDLSVGSALAVAGVMSVWLTTKGVPDVVAVLAGVATGGLCGALNGVLIAKLKLSPFIVTLGALTYLRGLAYVTTGAYPLIKSDLGFAFLGEGSVGFLPWPVIIALAVFVIGFIVLKRTVFGRRVYAIGGNEQAARLSGINVDRTLIWVYIISGVCTGIAGIIFSARLLSAQPMGGEGYELDAIAAVILGGTSFTGGLGSIVGTAIGALIIGVLNNGLVLMDVPFFYQLIVKGAVIVVAVLLDRIRVAQIRAA
ncbi:MAG: ABC transporter permease [Chloroflexi bacterium]|nr:ABC transporter permease [Chloroflexota bacterium]